MLNKWRQWKSELWHEVNICWNKTNAKNLSCFCWRKFRSQVFVSPGWIPFHAELATNYAALGYFVLGNGSLINQQSRRPGFLCMLTPQRKAICSPLAAYIFYQNHCSSVNMNNLCRTFILRVYFTLLFRCAKDEKPPDTFATSGGLCWHPSSVSIKYYRIR